MDDEKVPAENYQKHKTGILILWTSRTSFRTDARILEGSVHADSNIQTPDKEIIGIAFHFIFHGTLIRHEKSE